tara:strand:- start:350 stop:517 length:168 start_codon:yes stop_codon:yes gene_type:complete
MVCSICKNLLTFSFYAFTSFTLFTIYLDIDDSDYETDYESGTDGGGGASNDTNID